MTVEESMAAVLAEVQALRKEVADLRAPAANDAPPMPDLGVMSPEQVMAALGCKKSRMYQLLRQGRLQRAEQVGRELRITRASVQAVLAGPERRPVPPPRPKRQKAASGGESFSERMRAVPFK